MMDKKSWLLAILVIVGLTACAAMQSGVEEPSLPNDINIISPSPALPKEIAVFSGKWRGTWRYDAADAILVVEEIQDTWAQVVYSHRVNIKGGYGRFKCKVVPGPKPKLECPPRTGSSDGPIYFEVKDSNYLEGMQEVVFTQWRATNTVGMYRTN